jgi:hypothetical protein
MEIVWDIADGLWGLMLRAFVILMPLLVVLEWVRSRVWFRRFIAAATPVFDPVGFRPQAIFPLVTGLIFGISYGAGVLIPQARSGELDRKQIFLVAAFLTICHAVLEDTFLFVVVGGKAWVMVTARFLTALLVISILARLPWPAPLPLTATAGDREVQL